MSGSPDFREPGKAPASGLRLAGGLRVMLSNGTGSELGRQRLGYAIQSDWSIAA